MQGGQTLFHLQSVFIYSQNVHACFGGGEKPECTLIMCDTWFVKLCIPESRSPGIRNSHSLSLWLCSSFYSSVSRSSWLGLLLPCRSRIKLLLLPILFFWRWKITKASKALQASFLPLLIDFMLQLSPHHTHLHPNAHKLSSTLSQTVP